MDESRVLLWPQDNFTPHGFKTLSKALRPELKEFIFWTASQQLRKQNVEILRVMSFHFCTNALCVWTIYLFLLEKVTPNPSPGLFLYNYY